ncbi:MAG: iron-containing alcohol dehydrogenase [Clostridiales bacterium]|nr:iron-containing alcohol dehydrogenase [Clostridiales bacterium]
MLNFITIQNVKILAGEGTINKLGELLEENNYKKPFIVCGKSLFRNGTADNLNRQFAEKNITPVYFDKVKPDPPSDIVDLGAKTFLENSCDCIIGIGGGSAIDTAKGINIVRTNGGSILDYAASEYKMCKNLITIPTTSGTGSELSNGAIITNIHTGQKMPVLCVNCMSEYAVIDPELAYKMPKELTIMTGLDAFSHAAEAYTSVGSNIMLDPICEKIMEDIAENLPKAIADENNTAARRKLHTASSLAGWMLYNCCAHVGHSIAHVLGGELHIVHGAACAYGLPSVIKLISPACIDKILKIGKILGCDFEGDETAEEIADKTSEAYKNFCYNTLGLIPVNKLTLPKYSKEHLAELISAEPFAGFSPVKVDKSTAMQLLTEIFS